MCRRTLRILLVIVNILYFTIGAPQNGSAATARSTTATAEARYHPFFPKSSGKGLQGVLHVQNAGTADANFQVDFYTEQGTVAKRHTGVVKPGAAQIVAAQALADLPAGVYALRVMTANQQPVITVVRVKDTSRAVPGLAFDPGVAHNALATSHYGGPLEGGNQGSILHLFNPTANTVSGETTPSTMNGVKSAPIAWSLPAYGRTSIAFTNLPADFVGTVQITASTAIAAILQQKRVNDGVELQPFNPPATRHFLPRVLKAATEGDGIYATKLLIHNPNLSDSHLSIGTNLPGDSPTILLIRSLPAHNTTLISLLDDNLVIADGIHGAFIDSTNNVALVVNQITDAISVTTSTNATYPGQDTTITALSQSAAARLFFPRVVRTTYGYSTLNLQNNANAIAMVAIAAYNADGTQNGVTYSDRVAAFSSKSIRFEHLPPYFCANRRSFYRLTQIDDISNGTNREKRANFDSIGRKHLS